MVCPSAWIPGKERMATKRVHSGVRFPSKAEPFIASVGLGLFIGLFIVRRSFGGNDSERFLRLGSAFVVAAPLPLALGIAGDVYVVFLKISHCAATAIAAALTLLLTMLVPWYFYPVWLRSHRG
jgi:hypothetical protein